MFLSHLTSVFSSNRKTTAMVGGSGGGSFPSYTLPTTGQSLQLASTNTPTSIRPSAFSAGQFRYSLFNSYGFGQFNPDYSVGGAMVIGCTGGHQHPDFTGAVAYDFTDLTWYLHEHNNGGVRYGGTGPQALGYTESQTTGSPYYEISDATTGQVPVPGHPYHHNQILLSANGGGSKGSLVTICRAAMVEGGIIHSGSFHKFDLNTNLWSRLTTNQLTWHTRLYESGVVWDSARQRWWVFIQEGEGDTFVQYVQPSDWTVQQVSLGGFPPGVVGNGGAAWMYDDILFLQCTDGAIYSLDPDAPTSPSGGWQAITITGGGISNNDDAYVYYPRTGKFYQISQTGGATLQRLTPPGSSPRTNTWTHDTITVSPSLPRQVTDGDPSDIAGHYKALAYIPTIDRLAWFMGDDVYLLDPA